MKARIFALFALLISSNAAAAPPARQPTDKWVVDFGDAQCIAIRNYGSTDEPLLLVLKAPPIGDVLQLSVMSNGSYLATAEGAGKLESDGGAPIAVRVLAFNATKIKKRILLTNVPSSQIEQIASATFLRIRAYDVIDRRGSMLNAGSFATDLTFAVERLPNVLKLLRDCTLKLRKIWNVTDDGTLGSTLKEPPSALIHSLFKSSDYPGIALSEDQTGTATVALLVDENGKIANCTLVQTSGVAVLDAQTCAVIRERAKFRPATGLDGKPAKSSLIQRITWAIE